MMVPFEGEDRRVLVEQLIDLYDEVDTGGAGPRWVALEAPSGWGKTRVVQEFYARLVADRRGVPEAPGSYWPADIVPAGSSDGEEGVHAARKLIHPRRFDREGGSLPPFLWWGVSCSARNGVPAVALREDLVQLQAHRDFLVARCLQLDPLSTELRRSGRDLLRLAADEVGGTVEEAVVGAATSALSIAVPGIGLVWSIGKWSFGQIRDRHLQSRQVATASSIDTGSSDDVLADAVSTLRSVARPGLPLVIVVEDLQAADGTLVELLEELLGSGQPILVVTTSWPGALDDHPLDALLRNTADRVRRVRAGVDLVPLDIDARVRIVSAMHPGATADTAALLAARFENPLLLQLACTLGWVREEVDPRTGRLELTPRDVAEIPADAAGLYVAMWDRLPEPERRALALAVAAIPHEASPEVNTNRWITGQLVAAVRGALPQAPEVAAALGGTTTGWTRPVRDRFTAYLEPLAQQTAAAHGHLNRASRVRAVQDALFAQSRLQLTVEPVDEQLDLHAADIVIAWQLAGLAEDPTLFGIAVVEHTNALGPHTDDAVRALALADHALTLLRTTTDVEGVRTNLLLVRAHALAVLGRGHEAFEAYARAAEQLAVDEGADSPRALRARLDQASVLLWSGSPERALDLLEPLASDTGRARGPTDTATLSTLQLVSVALARSGRNREALVRDRQLLELMTDVLGPDDDLTLAARNNIAVNLAAIGRPDLAATELEAVVASRARLFGVEHPVTLFVRGNLAGELRRAGRGEQARTEREAVLEAQRRVLGPDHDDTLDSAMRLARLESDLGHHTDAVRAAREVVGRRQRRHGDGDARTARARRQLASVLGDADETEAALTQAHEALEAQVRLFGSRHVEVLDTLSVLGLLLLTNDRADEARPVYEELHAARLELHGSDHPGTLEARFGMLLSQPDADEVEVRARMSDDCARALGEDHPDTLAMREGHARLLVEAGRHDAAVDVLGPLARRYSQLDLARTGSGLQVRVSWSTALLRAGRWEEAAEALAELVADRLEILPEDDELTLVLRYNHAVALSHGGPVGEAVRAFRSLCEDQERLIGPHDPELVDTLEAWAGAVEVLAEDGWSAECDVALTELVAAYERVDGLHAESTARARAHQQRVRTQHTASVDPPA